MDHWAHKGFKTEWWYYTGHLFDEKQSRRFGYELTFFRIGTGLPGLPDNDWALDDIYMVHFAVSDVTGKRFYHTQRLGRSGSDLSGASATQYHVWVKDWFAKALETDDETTQWVRLKAGSDTDTDAMAIDLTVNPAKPPVVHGVDGVSQKADCRGCASHYYSYSRLETTGTLRLNGQTYSVEGLSWMDHEFGSNQLTPQQSGWDWFSIQLDDGSELMLYVLRRQDGQWDDNASGTYIKPMSLAIKPKSSATAASMPMPSVHLSRAEFSITKASSWTSPSTKGTYPMDWRIQVPSQGLDLRVRPFFKNQELEIPGIGQYQGLAYWEGACQVSGTHNRKPVSGQAYVEMTGYAQPFTHRL
ncbi:MAG: carotenoid 1,2-hydratase [Cyanobacteria bacterium HKST-UBA04]|nr:carotenoid 1,2-hydratase [Cyanobacteria bacterium HKST-UBA04]